MKKFNIDKIVSVSVHGFSPSPYYKYKKEISFFGFVLRKGGIYYEFMGSNYIGLNAPESHILRDGVIYENPDVTVSFVDESRKVLIFDSLEEAQNYANELINKGKWI